MFGEKSWRYKNDERIRVKFPEESEWQEILQLKMAESRAILVQQRLRRPIGRDRVRIRTLFTGRDRMQRFFRRRVIISDGDCGFGIGAPILAPRCRRVWLRPIGRRTARFAVADAQGNSNGADGFRTDMMTRFVRVFVLFLFCFFFPTADLFRRLVWPSSVPNSARAGQTYKRYPVNFVSSIFLSFNGNRRNPLKSVK